MSDALSLITAHCARTMPDSLSDRKALLMAIKAILTNQHPAMKSVAAQLAAIEQVEMLQAELPLKFNGK